MCIDILATKWSNHTKRMRKRRRFIGFLLFPVYLPHQANAKVMSSGIPFQLGHVAIRQKTKKKKKKKKIAFAWCGLTIRLSSVSLAKYVPNAK